MILHGLLQPVLQADSQPGLSAPTALQRRSVSEVGPSPCKKVGRGGCECWGMEHSNQNSHALLSRVCQSCRKVAGSRLSALALGTQRLGQ
jgi:hypothetical protein